MLPAVLRTVRSNIVTITSKTHAFIARIETGGARNTWQNSPVRQKSPWKIGKCRQITWDTPPESSPRGDKHTLHNGLRPENTINHKKTFCNAANRCRNAKFIIASDSGWLSISSTAGEFRACMDANGELSATMGIVRLKPHTTIRRLFVLAATLKKT